MLNKANRLSKDRDFNEVFKYSRPVSVGNLQIRSAQSKLNTEHSRFGFVISNKIDKRATRRNALKRQLRAITQSLLSEVKSGYDVIVQVRRNYNFPYDQKIIADELTAGIKKLGLIK